MKACRHSHIAWTDQILGHDVVRDLKGGMAGIGLTEILVRPILL